MSFCIMMNFNCVSDKFKGHGHGSVFLYIIRVTRTL